MMMTSSVVHTCVWLLAVAVMQASSLGFIGTCNKTLIQGMMTANLENCPTNLLNSMYEKGPQVQFRVMPQPFANVFSCATGVLERPESNVAILHNKYSFANTSLGYRFVNYTMAEASCGLLYKYIAEESYIGFKIVYAYSDGISFGYYGCTDEDNTIATSENDIYTLCYAPSIDTPEVEASLLKCKEHMAEATGRTDLVLTEPCDNNNEYLADVLATWDY